MGLRGFLFGTFLGLIITACSSIAFEYRHFGVELPEPCWKDGVALGPSEDQDQNMGTLCNVGEGQNRGQCTLMADPEFNTLRRDLIQCRRDLIACQEG